MFKDIRHQSYNYLLRDRFLWKRPKKRDGMPLKVVDDLRTKHNVLGEFMIHYGLGIEEFRLPTRRSWSTIGRRIYPGCRGIYELL